MIECSVPLFIQDVIPCDKLLESTYRSKLVYFHPMWMKLEEPIEAILLGAKKDELLEVRIRVRRVKIPS